MFKNLALIFLIFNSQNLFAQSSPSTPFETCIAVKGTKADYFYADTHYDVSCAVSSFETVRTLHWVVIPLPQNWFGKSYENLVEVMDQSDFGFVGEFKHSFDSEKVIFETNISLPEVADYCILRRSYASVNMETEDTSYAFEIACLNDPAMETLPNMKSIKDFVLYMNSKGYEKLPLLDKIQLFRKAI